MKRIVIGIFLLSAILNHGTLVCSAPIDDDMAVQEIVIEEKKEKLKSIKANVKDVDEIKDQITLYKQWREVLQFGTFYRGRSGNLHEWTCVSKDQKKAVGMIVQSLVEPNTHFEQYFVKGLKDDVKYHFYNCLN